MTELSRWHTWREIHAQPDIWRGFADELASQAREIAGWINHRGIDEVWLCGAGTSAFIGQILAAEMTNGPCLVAVATTDYVAAPTTIRPTGKRLLVVQFGRSGDSSETVGMLDLMDQLLPEADRLHITCNADSALATRAAPGPGEQRVLVLPEATHDRAFAMTSSFSTMLLSAAAILGHGSVPAQIATLATELEGILGRAAKLDQPRPERAIFLGSGALTGAARECALKVLELTAGQTMTQWDSTLGFRHGPKAAITPGSDIYVLLHPDHHTARYDADIAAEIRRQFPDNRVLTIGPAGDISIAGTGVAAVDAVLYVGVAQVLATRWSDSLGLNVDNPFAGGALSRVVSGVKLYALAR